MAQVTIVFSDEADGSAHVHMDSDVPMNVPGTPNTLAMELAFIAIAATTKASKVRGEMVVGFEPAPESNVARWRLPWWR